ncbi:MAG: oligosaccharide flippase family protein, partial [Patescibacteria group bacterium]|nr:oligosaccharide flippase family protein [Patescibacteria group bacterium]
MQFIIRVVTNTLFQVLSRLFSSGAGFFIAILIASHFGPQGYGEYAKVTAYVGIFYLIIDFGLNAVFLHKERAETHIKSLLFLRVVFALSLIVLSVGAAVLLPFNMITQVGFSPLAKIGIAIFSITLLTEGIVYSASALFQLRLSYRHLAVATLIGSLVTLAAVSYVVYASLPLVCIFASFVLGGITKAGVSLFLMHGKRLEPVRYVTMKELLLAASPVAVMIICNAIYFRVDMFILSILKTTRDVGIYDFAYKFFDFMIAIPLYMSNVLYPKLIAGEASKKMERNKLLSYVGIFGLASLFLAIPVEIAAPMIGRVRGDFVASVVPL